MIVLICNAFYAQRLIIRPKTARLYILYRIWRIYIAGLIIRSQLIAIKNLLDRKRKKEMLYIK